MSRRTPPPRRSPSRPPRPSRPSSAGTDRSRRLPQGSIPEPPFAATTGNTPLGRFFGRKKDGETAAKAAEVRAFHTEMHGILSSTIAELEAIDFQHPVQVAAAGPPVAEYAIALDASINVI